MCFIIWQQFLFSNSLWMASEKDPAMDQIAFEASARLRCGRDVAIEGLMGMGESTETEGEERGKGGRNRNTEP